ncbi:FAD binding domain-containing protein [Hymenobacter fodinae]|uniref:Monooxygenase n=1 Tax=Hymenobacter fodinae TaxID=2510796 RepID=A0A4Z0NZE7_9BACT|nr:FAD-dependent monooxygenase [Hymenobacter fodinae]TGE03789.1 monooxygenase [Hymenobacter fodinae]
MKIMVIGGSMAGLCAGIALRCKGYDVAIYERSAATIESRGAGLVVQPDLMNYLIEHNLIARELFGVPATHGQVLDHTGRVALKYPLSGSFTSWNHLWKHLKAHFPADHYHFSHQLAHVAQDATQATATFTNGTEVSGDLLIGADGYQSAVRHYLLPAVEPSYAGYLVYRGLVPEPELTPAEVALFANGITFFPYEHARILAYLVPGDSGEVTPGRRLLNWAWAANTPALELAELLRDKDGRARPSSVPPSFLSANSLARITHLAEEHLPAVFQRIVAKTEQPFLQAVMELLVPKMYEGRVAILGDAAFVVPPQTGSGTSKAYQDAIALAESLHYHSTLEAALAHWNSDRQRQARKLFAQGKQIAWQSGLGVE